MVAFSLGSAAIQARGAGKAADAQEQAAKDAAKVTREMFDITRRDLQPYATQGYEALNFLSQMYGLPPVTRQVENPEYAPLRAEVKSLEKRVPDFAEPSGGDERGDNRRVSLYGDKTIRKFNRRTDEFKRLNARLAQTPEFLDQPMDTIGTDRMEMLAKTPGYDFRFDEGTRALDRSASATGRLNSGAHERGLVRYGQDYATGAWENLANRMASIAGLGQTSTAQTGAFGAQAGSDIGNALMAGGSARASGYIGQANAIAGGINNAGSSIFSYGFGGF